MDVTITKLPSNDNKEENYILCVCWKADGFDLSVVHNDVSWQGNASGKHLEHLSQLVNMPLKDYKNETRRALSTPDEALQFSYHIVDDQFIWKKVVESNIKIKFGFVSLHEVPFAETIGKIVDELLQQNHNLQMEKINFQKGNLRSVAERTVLMDKLVEYRKQKLQMERTLFRQFLCVLNKKKQVMQHVPQDNENNGEPSSSVTKDSDHYDSDTEVEDTDEENDKSVERVSGDLFEAEAASVTFIPKRVGRQKRVLEQYIQRPGPSRKKPMQQAKIDPAPEPFQSTQDLWDEL